MFTCLHTFGSTSGSSVSDLVFVWSHLFLGGVFYGPESLTNAPVHGNAAKLHSE